MERKEKIHAESNKNSFSSIYNNEYNFFCTESGTFIKKNVSGYVDIKEKISLFHIPNPSLNQKPSKIYLTRKECCKLIGISIDEYLFIDHNMCGLKPIIKCNGKILFKMSVTSVIINCTEMWLLHPENNTSMEIIEKVLEIVGYNKSLDNNTPSTKISFGENSREFISPFYEKSRSNSSIEFSHNSSSEESENILSNSIITSFNESNTFDNLQENKNQLAIENNHAEISRINIENNIRYLPIFNKTNTHSLSFAALCIDAVLEVFNKELLECINVIKEEVINNCNGLIKSSKWYKYPWRFTFTDLTKKKLISKSLNDLEINISVFYNCLTEILEEIKYYKNNEENRMVICMEEWEDILHQYIPLLNMASKELFDVKASVTFSDELSKVYLDFQRNEYMYTNLKISLLTLSCSIASVITGVFGMNLLTGIEHDPIAWYIVTFLIVAPIIFWGVSSWFTGALCKREINYLTQK